MLPITNRGLGFPSDWSSAVWVTSNPYWRHRQGQDWEGSLSLSVTKRKSEWHGSISPGKRITVTFQQSLFHQYLFHFPQLHKQENCSPVFLLSCMHTSLELCTQIRCLHTGKYSLLHSVDFTVGFGTLQIKWKITFLPCKEQSFYFFCDLKSRQWVFHT